MRYNKNQTIHSTTQNDPEGIHIKISNNESKNNHEKIVKLKMIESMFKTHNLNQTNQKTIKLLEKTQSYLSFIFISWVIIASGPTYFLSVESNNPIIPKWLSVYGQNHPNALLIYGIAFSTILCFHLFISSIKKLLKTEKILNQINVMIFQTYKKPNNKSSNEILEQIEKFKKLIQLNEYEQAEQIAIKNNWFMLINESELNNHIKNIDAVENC